MCFAQHPKLAITAAVGVTSDVGKQEIPLSADQHAKPCDVASTAAQLAHWAADKLASYQVLRYYKWIDRFDLTPSERLRKHLLSRDLVGTWDRRAGSVVSSFACS